MAGSTLLPLPQNPIAYYGDLMRDKSRYWQFRDSELRCAEPCLLDDGSLEYYSGGYAVVYKVKIKGECWALRFFRANYTASLRDRLRTISDFVSTAPLPFFADFSFDPSGLRDPSNNDVYPVGKMPWINGETLNKYIEHHFWQEGKMAGLAEKFYAICCTMRAAGVAHGDLHPENIIVDRRGKLTLIDYDSMYVYDFSRKNLLPETCGLPDFQHPNRNSSRYFGADNDNFSALMIYLSIQALRHAPDLWKENQDRIIGGLAPSDFCNGSPLIDRLAGLSPDTAACVRALKRASRTPLEKTEPLNDVLRPFKIGLKKPYLKWILEQKAFRIGRALMREYRYGRRRGLQGLLKERFTKAACFHWSERINSLGRSLPAFSEGLAYILRGARDMFAKKKVELISACAGILFVAATMAVSGWIEPDWRDTDQITEVAEVKGVITPKIGDRKSPRLPVIYEVKEPAVPKTKPVKTNPAKTKTVKPRQRPPFPLASETQVYANTGVLWDSSKGKGSYERAFDSKHGKGKFKAYLGEYYENYKKGKIRPILLTTGAGSVGEEKDENRLFKTEKREAVSPPAEESPDMAWLKKSPRERRSMPKVMPKAMPKSGAKSRRKARTKAVLPKEERLDILLP